MSYTINAFSIRTADVGFGPGSSYLSGCCKEYSPLVALTIESGISSMAHDLHFRAIVVDTHDDTTQRLVFDHFDLGARHADGSIDIPRMRDGGVGAVFFSIWTPGTVTGPEAARRAIDQIEAIGRQVALHQADLVLATAAHDVREARIGGRIAVLMGVEGGHMINSNLGSLRTYASLGVRYMTLTHTLNNEWADASTDEPAHHGLTEFGKLVIGEMNRLGMMVDISHVSDKTFYDALSASQAPLIASHSSCRALCDAPRNLTDEMIKALAGKGGVIQIGFHVGFLSQEFRDAQRTHPELRKQIAAESRKRCGENEACQVLETEKLTRELVAQGRLPRVDWTEIVNHIDHAVKLVGADHVGLGSDFDGASMPYGMEDASHLPQITEALQKKGYSEAGIEKILGGNTLRLIEDVGAIAKKMEGTAE
jgi:membrane dipeptidase